MCSESIKITWRMVLNAMVGNSDELHNLYEKYLHQQRLYVSIGEILEAKKGA
jgi:hypothetical protein